jgi:hypothetical protein
MVRSPNTKPLAHGPGVCGATDARAGAVLEVLALTGEDLGVYAGADELTAPSAGGV